MLDIVVRGLRQRAEVSSTGNPRKGWGGNTASNAENANKEDVGYSPSDLLPLKQLVGVMTELIGMRLNEGHGG
jgi:hypothetical protein